MQEVNVEEMRTPVYINLRMGHSVKGVHSVEIMNIWPSRWEANVPRPVSHGATTRDVGSGANAARTSSQDPQSRTEQVTHPAISTRVPKHGMSFQFGSPECLRNGAPRAWEAPWNVHMHWN